MEPILHVDMGPLGYANEKECTMIVLRGHVRFVVKVNIADIDNTDLGGELLQKINMCQADSDGRHGSLRDLLDIIYRHCLPLLKRLAPQTSLQDLKLEGLLHSQTYNLELVNSGVDGEIRVKGEDICTHMPSFVMSPMQTIELPESCKAFPRFQASKTQIDPTLIENGKSLSSIQGKVMIVDGATMYFKPRIDGREPEFERELHILSRIEEAGLGSRIRVPTLQGIVVAGENGETTIGMLITWITSPDMGIHLQSPSFHGQPELHRKWAKQGTAIVQELHDNDMVWGDVNPMNVVIDKNLNAWVIDFGGMNNVEFVDEENRETVAGDEQGISRLFQEWLPGRLKIYEENQHAQENAA